MLRIILSAPRSKFGAYNFFSTNCIYNRLYNVRDREVYVQVKTSYLGVEGKGDGDGFASNVHGMAREEDRKGVRRDWAFANNLVEGVNLEDV
jgi:hypothetical protein